MRLSGRTAFLRTRFFWNAGLLVATLSTGAAADTPRDQSRAAFRRGVALAQSGDYAHAREAFVEAYRLYPHPSILLNLGIARWKAGDMVPAEQDLVKFLADDGGASPEEVQSARAALAQVRSRLGTLHVRVSPRGATATLDGQPIALVPGEFADVRALVGTHQLEAQAAGFASKRQTASITAGTGPNVVDMALVPLEAPPARAAAAPQLATAEAPPPAPEGNGRKIVGWSLVGTGAAAGGFGVFAAIRAMNDSRIYNGQPAGKQDSSLRKMGIVYRTLADVAFAVGAVSTGVGVYLLLTGGAQSSAVARPETSLFVGFDGAGVRGSF